MTILNPANIVRSNWLVKFNDFQLGLTDEVNPALKMMLDSIKAGTTGKIILGHRFVGMEGTISVDCKETSPDLFRAMMPWATDPTSLDLTPPMNTDMYTFAQELRLHPTFMDETDLSLDLVLVKSVPTTALNITKKGEEDDTWKVEFQIYPDREKLLASPSVAFYGYVGETPPSNPE